MRRLNDPATALEADLLAECRRGGLPRPEIEVHEDLRKIGIWDCSAARSLSFRVAVAGPMLLGRDRHFGGGLFVATDKSRDFGG